MNTLRDYMIKDETDKRLAMHGFNIDIGNDQDADSPREWMDSVFVGGEIKIPSDSEVDRGENFEEFVHNYCRDILNCKITDIIWLPVFKFDHTGVAYSVTPFSDRWDSGRAGFIYETKENIRKEHNVKRISQAIKEQTEARLTSEIETYSLWANGDVYYAQVTSNDEYFNESCSWLLESDVDRVANELIDQVIRAIDKDGRSVVLEMTVGELDRDETAVQRINEVLEDHFGIKISVGTIEQEENLKVILAVADLPSFLHLAQSSSDNLFNIVAMKAVELNLLYNNEQKDTNDYLQEITANKSYHDWSNVLLNALITTLFDDIDVANIINISPVKEVA